MNDGSCFLFFPFFYVLKYGFVLVPDFRLIFFITILWHFTRLGEFSEGLRVLFRVEYCTHI